MAAMSSTEPFLSHTERIAMSGDSDAERRIGQDATNKHTLRRFVFVPSLSSAVIAALLGVFVFWLGVQQGARSAMKLQTVQSEEVTVEEDLLMGRHRRHYPPTVILVSCDAFRWDYPRRVPTPNLERLRQEGTTADGGIIPVFPSVTFPNHYSIATGLFPESHGIVAQYFTDPATGDKFRPGKIDRKWWTGEPIWETLTKQGVKAATYFWPGSEVNRTNWNCIKPFCPKFNSSVSLEQRVDDVLSFFDMEVNEQPRFINLYLNEPDSTSHKFGSDAPQVNAAIERVDSVIGRLLDGLESRRVLNDIHLIVLGDHGMLTICGEKSVYLEDLSPLVANHSDEWIENLTPNLGIRPGPGYDVKAIYEEMKRNQPTAENGPLLSFFLKEEFPERFHYKNNDRIPPIIGYSAEGYGVRVRRGDSNVWLGQHGFDNQLQAMHPIFYGRGPRFARRRYVPTFANLEVYNIVCELLGVMPSPNNGTKEFSRNILLRPHEHAQ